MPIDYLMRKINMRFGRSVFGNALLILSFLAAAGCSQAPGQPAPTTTQTPLPTLVLEPVQSVPTPTLASNAPTRALPTPLVTRTANEIAQGASDTFTPTPPGPSPTPSATPEIAERLILGDNALGTGDYSTAAEQFGAALRQEPTLDKAEQEATLLKLGRAFLSDERYMDAATIFNQLFALAGAGVPAEAYFWLGQAHAGQNDFAAAIEAYEFFLTLEPHMGGYVYPLIAESYHSLADNESAKEALALAAAGPAFRLKEVETRLALAADYLASGEYTAAIEQYDAVHDLAETEATRGQMTYLAGAAELAAGNVEAANERFQLGLDEYPGAYESYLGLVELVKAEVPVDDYQRGVVDYNAAAYAPAVEALLAYIDAAADGEYEPQAHYYLALSHEALGETEEALEEMARYAELAPQQGLLERAKLHARSEDVATAIELYREYVDTFSESEEAPFAAWWLAALTAEEGDAEAAIELFVALADAYPEHVDAPEALHVAGNLAHENDDLDSALTLLLRAAEQYPTSVYGSAALLDLLLIGSDDVGSELYATATELALSPANSGYHALRARDLVQGTEPFSAEFPFALPTDESSDREMAETWLAEQFGLDSALVEGELSEALASDDRLRVGARLWELGLYEESKRELEALRQAHAEDPLSTYQLALFFRDLGLYRSSIIAAATLLNLASTHELAAPAYLGRLSYPAYYADLIVDLAQQHGFDPRLQLALVRQESLFESFARSGAAAQGLSQVIPDTGAWIAEQLQWPDYVNEDLYKPYVGLTFGAFYLAEQLDYFDGNVHAALAAYNAGPGNAARWYREAGSDLDQFVKTIDFNETETYVKRIYAGYALYRHLYPAN